ncbi:3-oxoacyl-reductase [Penicillium sp. IBT 35674x]|nr:3-oxoacyl-reductase [Penicillium sp. IBT 35674x]
MTRDRFSFTYLEFKELAFCPLQPCFICAVVLSSDVIRDFWDCALVTGAGTGIGRDAAIAFAAEGAIAVAFVDINLAAAKQSADQSVEYAPNPAYCPLAVEVDVTDLEGVEHMVAQVVETFKRIGYSVNSAGIKVREPKNVIDTSMEEFERLYCANVLGKMNCVKAIGGAMRQQDPLSIQGHNGELNTGRGSIVNLGSANSYIATRNIVQYTTSKHAVVGITRNAAPDIASDGVRVNTVCPSWVDIPMVTTAMNGNPQLSPFMESTLPFKCLAQTEKISDVICSPRASYVTGSDWVVEGGMTLTLKT